MEEDLKPIMKPQYVDHIPKKIKDGTTVGHVLKKKDQKEIRKKIMKTLELKHIKKREIKQLSGGELQRFAIGMIILYFIC